MNQFDAIVVGAGPAGSTCAGRLKSAGMSVKLFDKAVFPRVKPCAGWVTPQVVESLQLDLEEYRRENTLQPITGFWTGTIGGGMVETNYDHPISYGILRREFDDYLLRRSEVPCEFQAVKQISRGGDGWNVNGATAPLVIGAGGNFCPVRRHLVEAASAAAGSNGRKPGRESEPSSRGAEPPTVYAQEVEYKISADEPSQSAVDPAKPELYFCRDMRGYGWCFRKGEYLNVGLGRIDKEGLSGAVEEFCQFLRQEGKIGYSLPDRFAGHAYRLYANAPPRLVDDGLLLIGDSAGLAYPNSGEGIRPAVESALIAAEVIAAAQGDYSAGRLEAYARELGRRLGRPKRHEFGDWLPASWLQSLAARLLSNRWFAKRVVLENWFLHRHQPAYAPAELDEPLSV